MTRHAVSSLPRRGVVLNLFARKSAPVTDLPSQDSRQINRKVGPGVTPGKHVHDEHTSTLLALVAPQRFFCLCGERATHLEPSPTRGEPPRYYCGDHRPLGIFGVIDGGGSDAA